MSTFIHPTVIFGENVTIGQDVYIGPYCVIGFPAEWKGKEHNDMGVIIEDGARLTGLVTVDSGVNAPTRIGANCYIMKHCHIGHDAILEDNVTMAPGAVVGGHCIIGVMTNIGINASIHQKVRVGYGNMIGMGAVITKATEFSNKVKYAGVPAKIIGENNHG